MIKMGKRRRSNENFTTTTAAISQVPSPPQPLQPQSQRERSSCRTTVVSYDQCHYSRRKIYYDRYNNDNGNHCRYRYYYPWIVMVLVVVCINVVVGSVEGWNIAWVVVVHNNNNNKNNYNIHTDDCHYCCSLQSLSSAAASRRMTTRKRNQQRQQQLLSRFGTIMHRHSHNDDDDDDDDDNADETNDHINDDDECEPQRALEGGEEEERQMNVDRTGNTTKNIINESSNLPSRMIDHVRNTTHSLATASTTTTNTTNTNTVSMELQFVRKRVVQLEQLVSVQQVTIRQLTHQVQEIVQTTEQLTNIIGQLLVLQQRSNATTTTAVAASNYNDDLNSDTNDKSPATTTSTKVTGMSNGIDDLTHSIFGTAPATVMDAADAAGAAILAGILGGKQRMLVDVRDAELTFDNTKNTNKKNGNNSNNKLAQSETLVQFIELAILPVAAGLEGMRSRRNRLKVVFPTVSHLLTYRKSMALSAPDVVALSTLGFDPVEQKDNLVVILVPSPNDEEGLVAMNELLSSPSLTQPVVVINHHMVPVTGLAATFEVAYHLRLLSVQYMSSSNNISSDDSGGDGSSYFTNATDSAIVADMIQQQQQSENGLISTNLHDGDDFDIFDHSYSIRITEENDPMLAAVTNTDTNVSLVSTLSVLLDDTATTTTMTTSTTTPVEQQLPAPSFLVSQTSEQNEEATSDAEVVLDMDSNSTGDAITTIDHVQEQRHDDAVEAAMKHAQLVGTHHHGSTRAMVIRAYPRAWHVFVDTSPDTDADYEVAAIFADEPNVDQVNDAIIECIEGSELEDELVAQQMQQAFESGQLDRVSELLASIGLDDLDDDDDDNDDDDDPYMKMFGEDTE